VEAIDLAKEVARYQALRGADAIHLGSALLLQRRFEGEEEDQLQFITSDRELKEAAQSSGLSVSDPQEEETATSQSLEEEEGENGQNKK
jgi:hypothetical protein